MKHAADLLFLALLCTALSLVASCGSAVEPLSGAADSASSKTLAAPATFKLTGTIRHGVSGLYGVRVALSGTASLTATTNSSGEFSFTGLKNGEYTVTPTKAGFTFDSLNIVKKIGNADVSGADFTAAQSAGATYKLLGSVTSDGAPLTGVTITLGGGAGAAFVNDADGGFVIDGLTDGVYSITAAKPGFVFFPASAAVVVSGSNISDIKFAGTHVESTLHNVAGRVTFNGTGLQGAIVKLSGPVTGAAVTDAAGNFLIPALPNGGYSLVPSKPGYTFIPVDRAITINSANAAEVDFSAAGPSYNISGRAHLVQCRECNVQGAVVSLNTVPPVSVMTGLNGLYSFNGVPNGVYTVTPDMHADASVVLPRSAVVRVENANAVDVDFGVNAVYKVSGAVHYAGAKTGRVYVGLRDAGTNDAHYAGTSMAAPGAYAVRGVPPGNYRVCAWMDNLGSGRRNSGNPAGCSDDFSVIGGAAVGVNITMTDPPALVSRSPASVNAAPFDGGALVTWLPFKANGVEAAQSYNIYYATDASSANKTSGVSIANIPAIDDGHYMVNGLANGETYYFAVSALVNGVESEESAVSAPVRVGLPTGGAAITGNVAFSGNAKGPLYVGYYGGDGRIYIARIANPVSPAAYTVAGAAQGVYVPFAFIDSDNSNTISPGDARNYFQNGSSSTVTIIGDRVNNILAGSGGASVSVTTGHWTDGISEDYLIKINAGSAERNIVSAVIESGANLPSPIDLSNQGGYFSMRATLEEVAPLVGDPYVVTVSYADGTSETRYIAVSGVVDSFAAPVAPVGAVRNMTSPVFRWNAPENLPSVFIYNVEVVSMYAGVLWRTDAVVGIPAAQNSVVYNFDNSAAAQQLIPGTPHFWEISVTDESGNSSSRQSVFTP